MNKFLKIHSDCAVRTMDIPFNMVAQNLALSPTDMLQMTENGLPISTNMLSAEYFDDGKVGLGSEIAFSNRRGIEAVDVYEYQSRARSKLSKALKDYKPQNNN